VGEAVTEKQVDTTREPPKKRRLSIHPLFVDLGLTGFTSAAVLVTSLVMVSVFGKILGAVALAEYLLIRRMYSWLQSATLLGIDSALPRYVAMTDASEPRERDGFLLTAILCGGVVVLLACAILNAAGGTFSQWIFGEKGLRSLVLALSLFLAGGDAHGIVYGFYRGQLAMKRANTLQVINLVLVPVACVIAFARFHSTALIVDVMGALMILFSFLFSIPLLPQIMRAAHRNLRTPSKKLLEYGVPRLPSIFGLGALLALGPIVASQKISLARVTPLLLGTSMLMGIAASAEPLGLILLSKVSMFVAQNRTAELRKHLTLLQEAVVACYAFICLQMIVFADVVLRAWVGNRLAGGLGIVRLLLVAIPFYLLFAALRSIIDATSVTPYNTFNILITFGIFLLFLGAALFFSPKSDFLWSVALAMVVAIAILAGLTVRTMRKMYQLETNWARSAAAVLLSVALAALSYGLRVALGPALNLASALGIGLLVTAIFVLLLKRTGSPWLPFFWNIAFQRRVANV
jgi:O-antigen/teichoic acid export membrane protein